MIYFTSFYLLLRFILVSYNNYFYFLFFMKNIQSIKGIIYYKYNIYMSISYIQYKNSILLLLIIVSEYQNNKKKSIKKKIILITYNKSIKE
jgi:hypothetical protein